MASRIMHLALAREILARRELRDPGGFALGSILPDAPRPMNQSRASHFVVTFMNRGREMRTYDTRAFCGVFGQDIAKEGIYLGYYMHLVQDVAFRRFLYCGHDLHCRTKEELLELYGDYGILNRLLIERHSLSFPEDIPEDLEDMELCRMFQLDAQALFGDLREDFAGEAQGEPKRFGLDLAEEYLASALEQSLSELDALRAGGELLDPWALAWERK